MVTVSVTHHVVPNEEMAKNKTPLFKNLSMTNSFFVTQDGQEFTHTQMTQSLMKRVTQLEDSNKLLQHQILNLIERLHYMETIK